MTEDTNCPRVGPTYSYKPSLLGAAWEFHLLPNAIEWQVGRMQGRTLYRDITRVRLSYRPATMQSRRFLTEVWSSQGPRLAICSTSWRGMVELAAQDEAYGNFVRELHRRIAAGGPEASFEAGSPALLYWPGLVIVAGAVLVLAALAVHALLTANWPAAAIVGAFFGLFAWQGGTFFWRNRPGRYRPDALPTSLVPRA